MSDAAMVTTENIFRRLPLKIKKLSENAILPKQGSPFAAGVDLCAAKACQIPVGGRLLVPTDLSIACPPGTYGRIAPRSGLAYKHGIDVGAGVIDADYRGPVGVILFNFGSQPFDIQLGDRVAQLILEQIVLPDVEEVQELDDTVRGAGGFGSTGVATEEASKKQRTEENVTDTAATVTPSSSSDAAEDAAMKSQ
jgi:dUTP pyrophosphatase